MAGEQAKDELIRLDRLRAIAQLGLNYTSDPYDIARYEELLELTSNGYERVSGVPADQVSERFRREIGHITPKVGVEGAVFSADGERILLIRRADYGDWALPAGWAEVGETLEAAVAREVEEETGVQVEVGDVISVHTYSASSRTPHARCAVVYHCLAAGGDPHPTDEALDARYQRPTDVTNWCEHAAEAVAEAMAWYRRIGRSAS